MLELKKVSKSYEVDERYKHILFEDLDLKIEKGEFVTVVGGNGAGKSSLLKLIIGDEGIDDGNLLLDGKDITNLTSYKRCRSISKVFQDPKLGTASNMTILENMSMVDNKGKFFGLGKGVNKRRKDHYKELLKSLGLGLENHLYNKVGLLSGGQRQCLALIMATLNTPKLLLLDEHTAALDPKTANIVMEKTRKVVEGKGLSTIMITHNIEDALKYGNRLIMLDKGKIVVDIKGEEKDRLTREELFKKYFITS